MGRKALLMDSQTRKHYNDYNLQRRAAGYRNIEWQFTLESWLAWWGDDLNIRGKGSGKLVMARNNDTGPYSPDNVHKATHNQNSKERWRGKPVITPAGRFETLTFAARHYGISLEGIRNRIKRHSSEYKYA